MLKKMYLFKILKFNYVKSWKYFIIKFFIHIKTI